jgi:predicted enzyme related to lactoylglutathione lyase
MANAVIHFEINVRDRAKSVEFYSQLFGWQINTAPGFDYSLVEPANDKSIGGGIGPCQPGQSPSVTFYVGVDSLQPFLDKAQQLGGNTVMPPTPIPGIGHCAMFTDLDGNVVGLFSS